jgi:hypothetical protein
MLSTVGVALLAAKGFAVDPVVVGTALGTGAVVSCAALGSSWLPQHQETTSEPGS